MTLIRRHSRKDRRLTPIARGVAARPEHEVPGWATVFHHVCVIRFVVEGFAFGCPLERFQRERLSQLVLHERSRDEHGNQRCDRDERHENRD
jgi:hypothetical protein